MSATFPQPGELQPNHTPSAHPAHLAPVGITVGVAVAAWILAWFVGSVFSLVPFQIAGAPSGVVGVAWFVLVGTIISWTCMVTATWVTSRRFGTGQPLADYGISFRPVDLLGVPLGVITQVALLPALYWPLKHWWPATFHQDKLERNARDLVNATHGAGWIALLLLVLVGAPLVEELVYRGLIHGALVRRLSHVAAVVVSAALFSAIHLRPVEFPGLFLIGVVLAVAFSATRRLGMSIVTHVAFNAVALLVAAR